MKKILFIYYRPDFLDISNYPFFHKLVEQLSPSFELSLLDMSNSNIEELSYGLKAHFPFRKKLFTLKGFRRFNTGLFKVLCIQKILSKKYEHIIVIGANTIDAIPAIKQYTKAKVSYLDDEFPWLYRRDYKTLSNCLSLADLIISLDNIRGQVLLERLQLSIKTTLTIANMPSNRQLKVDTIDWLKRLNLSPEKKYVLFHGSLGPLCQLPEIMCTTPLWGEQFELIILGWREQFQENYKHLLNKKITTVEGRLNDYEYNSLLKFSYASLGLYSEFLDLEFVGSSSGKILRSIFLETPVIANHYQSLSFVTELGVGVQIKSVLEIPQILENRKLKERIFNPDNNKFSEQYQKLSSYFLT